VKSGGRKLNLGTQTINNANPQLRYRPKKTPSVNVGSALNVSQLPAADDCDELEVNIRNHLKEKQFVSLNATQILINESLDLSSQTGPQTTYSTIAAG